MASKAIEPPSRTGTQSIERAARVVAGVHSFGVAVCDPDSSAVLGSVLMSGPPERLPLEQIMRILPQLQEVADDVARRWVHAPGARGPGEGEGTS